MICADTSSVVAFIKGERGQDVALVDQALADHLLLLAPASLCELLSDFALRDTLEAVLLAIPRLEVTPGYWERTGKLRAKLFRHGFRPSSPSPSSRRAASITTSRWSPETGTSSPSRSWAVFGC